MLQDDNLRDWAEYWKTTTSSLHKETDEKRIAKTWNKRWEEHPDKPKKGQNEEMMNKSVNKTISFLEEAGFLIKGSKVLDIGCGPGTLALPLARMGAEVTALDISSKVLERVKEVSQKEGLPVDTAECSWWSAEIDELGFRNMFDLVIASRTPSINDSVSLERMMACSRKMCYYSGFLSAREDSVHREIHKLISGESSGHEGSTNVHNAYTLFFPFLYLYFKGYRPLVKINRMNRGRVEIWEAAAERAIDFFSHDRDPGDEVKEEIRVLYKNASVNGMYPLRPAGCHGMMVWRVNNR